MAKVLGAGDAGFFTAQTFGLATTYRDIDSDLCIVRVHRKQVRLPPSPPPLKTRGIKDAPPFGRQQ